MRRLDVVEFVEIAKALEMDPAKLLDEIVKTWISHCLTVP